MLRAWRRVLRRRAFRLPSWRSAFVTVALVGTMLISAAAAWGVHSAWAEHRNAIDATLDEYATYAARTFGEQLFFEGRQLRLHASSAVIGKDPTQPPLTLRHYAARAGDALDDAGLGDDPWRGYFRIDARDTSYTALLAARRQELAAQVLAAVSARWERFTATRDPLIVVVMVGDEQISVAMIREEDTQGHPVAIFGHTQSRRIWLRELSEQILGGLPLIPPSLIASDWSYGTGAQGSDTLVAISVLDHQGTELYRSPASFASEVRGEFTFRTSPGGFVVRAAIHPGFVERIRAGDPLNSRRHLFVALPLLALLLAAAAIVHLARERELVRSRRDFVASVSHELRTPLAQIRMFAETLMLRRERDEEERLKWIGVIGREARRLGDLVESILLFSHIEAARIRLEKERTDLGELVEDVVEGYIPIAAARRMRLMADAPSRIMVDADPRALRQVIVNLLDNALKYGPEGQTVALDVERDGDRAVLAVTDEGRGIAEEDRVRLWQPFVRLQHDGGSTGGSGIGLSVVRTLVEKHGGTVWVEDGHSGRGARFVVALPLDLGPAPSLVEVIRAAVTAEHRIPSSALRADETPAAAVMSGPDAETRIEKD